MHRIPWSAAAGLLAAMLIAGCATVLNAQTESGTLYSLAAPPSITESVQPLAVPPGTPATWSGQPSDVESRLQALEAELARQRAETEALREQLNARTQADSNSPGDQSSDEAYRVGSDLRMTATWKNGLVIESENKDFSFHVGGRTHFDGVWFADSEAFLGSGGAMDADAVNLRRGRLRAEGRFYEQYEWCIEYDFTNTVNNNVGLEPATESNVSNTVVPCDAWWAVRDLPILGTFVIGNQKEPIGLEHITSSRYLDFMERSFNQDAFTGPFNNGFTPGLSFHQYPEGEWGSFAWGLFKNTPNPFAFGAGDDEYALDARVTLLPWYDEASDGRYLIHLGLSGSFRENNNQQLRIRSRASLRNGPGSINPVLADTGQFNTNNQRLIGLEAATVAGPLTIQAEYIHSFAIDASTLGGVELGTYEAYGYYVSALWFLTGEHRTYDHKRGAFSRIVPFENAFLLRSPAGVVHGRGAWQIGARYSHLNLSDGGLDGGTLQDMTIGLNWFLNPNMKVQWNYVLTYRDAPNDLVQGFINGFGMRLAHDF